MDGLPLSRETICEETQRDSTLKTVISCVERSNCSKIAKNSDLLPFNKNKDSLSVDENVLLLHRDGLSRVVIPSVLQPKVLQLLHEAHWGISRMKQMARRYVWWSKINSDIESMFNVAEHVEQLRKRQIKSINLGQKLRNLGKEFI